MMVVRGTRKIRHPPISCVCRNPSCLRVTFLHPRVSGDCHTASSTFSLHLIYHVRKNCLELVEKKMAAQAGVEPASTRISNQLYLEFPEGKAPPKRQTSAQRLSYRAAMSMQHLRFWNVQNSASKILWEQGNQKQWLSDFIVGEAQQQLLVNYRSPWKF